MSKTKMIFYGVLGSLVSVLIWSFIGGCHTSSRRAPEQEISEPVVREKVAPPAPVTEETLIEEGIIVREKPAVPAEPVREEVAVSPEAEPMVSRVHTVKQGDTLWGISRRYGVTVQSIEKANNLADPGRLAVGQRLTIP